MAANGEEAKGGGGLPAAIERFRLVVLPVCKKTVEVRRWSFTRQAMVSRYLSETISSLPDDVEQDFKKAIDIFYSEAPDKFVEICKFSVPEEYRAMIDDEWFDSVDLFAIMDAAFAINQPGGGMGKMSGLVGRFLLEKAASQVQQEIETKAMAAK